PRWRRGWPGCRRARSTWRCSPRIYRCSPGRRWRGCGARRWGTTARCISTVPGVLSGCVACGGSRRCGGRSRRRFPGAARTPRTGREQRLGSPGCRCGGCWLGYGSGRCPPRPGRRCDGTATPRTIWRQRGGGPMAALEEWTTAASEAVGLDSSTLAEQQRMVLELAREVAHHVVRPAAPLTTYLLGVAVGRGADPAQAAAALRALAARWTPEEIDIG